MSKHIHRYTRVNIASFGKPDYWVYKCTKPFCTSYTPMKLAEGKICECNICGDVMLIDRRVMHTNKLPMLKPHCLKCVKKKDRPTIDLDEFMKDKNA